MGIACNSDAKGFCILGMMTTSLKEQTKYRSKLNAIAI